MSAGPTRRAVLIAGLATAGAGAFARQSRPAPLSAASAEVVAKGLVAPEGIACARDGRIFVSVKGSGYAVLDGRGGARPVGPALPANGIALDGRGGIVIACFGLLSGAPGPLLRIDLASGARAVLADRAGGRRLVASNMPAVARDGSVYCTHSRWHDPANIGATLADGFVYRARPGGEAEIVAAGLAGANGCCFDVGERHLYVALTAAGRIVRMARSADGRLGPAAPFGPLLGEVFADQRIDAIRAMPAAARARLGYPDGLAFDLEGNLWVTLPFANRIVAITPAGALVNILHDPAGRVLDGPTNLAWGGRDGRLLHIVSRAGGLVSAIRTPVAGLALRG